MIFTEDFAARVNFRLKIFYIDPDTDTDGDFLKFLRSQSTSLEELYVKEVDFDFLQFVQTNLRNLKKLSFCMDTLVQSLRMYEIWHLRFPDVIELTLDFTDEVVNSAVSELY